MLFSDIKPFVRFARYFPLDYSASFTPHIPYDARLFYAHDGHGAIELDGNIFRMEEGSVLIINSGIEYHIKTPENNVTYIAFNFDYTQSHNNIKVPVPPEIKSNFNPKNIIENVEFQDFKVLDSYIYIHNIDSIQKIAAKIVTEFTRKHIGYELKTSCMFAEILVECLRKAESEPSIQNNIANEVINYIHKNYNIPLTNIKIGGVFNLHPNYISKLIKQSTGVPLHKYILHVRLLHAIELLEIGTFSIGEIANKCGFCDVYYFSRYFKSAMNMTPSEYIRK